MSKPAGFLLYQWELRESIRTEAVVVVQKSRRTGYSWAAAEVATETAAKKAKDGGMDVYYMGYNMEMGREFVEYCGDWGKLLQIGLSSVGETIFKDQDNPDKDIKAFRMETSAHKIVVLPSMPRALRGMQGLVILDEAAFHEDLEALLKAAFALLIWGGKVVIISTHDGEDNPFNSLIQDILAGRKPYKLLTCDFNRALVEGLYKRICQKQGKQWSKEAQDAWRDEIIAFYGDGADEELFCIPASGSGIFLPRNMIESVMDAAIPVVRWEPPAGDFVDWELGRAQTWTWDWCDEHLLPLILAMDKRLRTAVGEDFGRSGDLTVIHPVQETRTLDLVTPFLLELRNCPFRTQKQILWYILDRVPNFSAAAMDARGNGQALAEETRQQYGADRIAEVMLSESFYREHMPRLKAQFEDRSWNLPRDSQIMDDYRALKIVRGVPRVPDTRTQGESGKRHGDAAIAGLLAVHAAKTMEGGEPFEAMTAMTSHSSRMFRGY